MQEECKQWDVSLALFAVQEECKQWDVSPALFSPALWPVYHSIMRADFNLFDQYQFTHEGTHLTLAHVLKCSCTNLQMIPGFKFRLHNLLQTSMSQPHIIYTYTYICACKMLVCAAPYHSMVVSKCCDRRRQLSMSVCCLCMQEKLHLLFL